MKQSFLKNAAYLSAAGLAAKAIGAFYRIPLFSAVGGYGMGLYQMAYPLFCVLLTFSSAGIPAALSRLIAQERARGAENASTLHVSLRLFAVLGIAGTFAMCLLSPWMARLQGDRGLTLCYFALAPSVFLVALIAVLRGYFQGKNDMIPTAVSELVEQIVKAGAGLLLASRFPGDPQRAVAAALFGVTLSELAALAFLAVRRRAERVPVRLEARRASSSAILFAVLPVMAATSLLPLSQTVDSVVIVKLLSRFTPRAVTLYGLYAGGAAALVNLPVSVVYGLAAASVPAVAEATAAGDSREGRRRALFALGVTVLLSSLAAVGLLLFADLAVSILYPALSGEDARTLVLLLRLCALSAVTLSGTDTLAACLTGMGKARRAAGSMLVAVLAKLGLQFVLIGPAFGVAGAAVAANGCYLIAFLLDLVYTVKKDKRRKGYDHSRRSRRREGRSRHCGEECASSGG